MHRKLRLRHTQRLMARRNTWSSRQPTIRELPDDEAEELLTSDNIRKSIVLSMRADDEDWSNYRRRSSGGTAAQVFNQSRSRRTSRDDTCTGEAEPRHIDGVKSGENNHKYDPQIEDETDASCEDLLRFVKEKLDKFEMENNDGGGPLADERRRRYGSVNRQPNVNRLMLDKEKYRPSRPPTMSRFVSEPGPEKNDFSPTADNEMRSYSSLDNHHHTRKYSSSSLTSSGVFDISGQTSDNRFPWLKDQSTQCQILTAEDVEQKETTAEKALAPLLSYMNTANLQQRAHPSPRTSRSQSQSAIFGVGNDRMRMQRKHDSTSSLPVIHDGKVILKPDVLQHSLEFYAEQAAEKLDPMDDPITSYKGGRRSCVISGLQLGDSGPETESSEVKSYPGDLVLHNGQALRQPSPTAPVVNGGTDHYGSEGSLVDSVSTGSSTLSREEKKPLKYKMSTGSFLTKVVGWKEKRKIPDLEYFLMNMGVTEFKDEKLASYRRERWPVLLTEAGTEPPEIPDAERTRRDAIWEIFTNECTFLVDHLMVLKHCFLEPLKKCQVEGLLMEIEPDKLFGNLDVLCDLSYRFCLNFLQLLRQSAQIDFASTEVMCRCLDEMTINSRDGDIYHSYLLNYRSALTYLDILRNTIEDYAIYERRCEQDPRCKKLRLSDLLIAPMQHWTRLPLLLKNIRKYTLNHSDKEKLDASIEKVVSSTKSLENKIDWLKTFERVKEIEKQLVWPTISEIDNKAFIPDTLKSVLSVQPTNNLLDNQTREITFEGPLILTEKDRTTDAYVFLFSDFLLFTKIRKDAKKTRGRMSTVDRSEGFYHVLRQPIPIESLSVHDIGPAEASISNMKNLFVVVQRNSFQQVIGVFTLQAHTSLGKEKWLDHLRDNKEKNTEINNNKSEVASRQKSFMDNHENGGLLSHNLLKHSKVLEITNTLPRSKSRSTKQDSGPSRPKSFNQSLDGNISPIATHKIYEKSRTLSTSCLNGDHTGSQLSLIGSSDYVH